MTFCHHADVGMVRNTGARRLTLKSELLSIPSIDPSLWTPVVTPVARTQGFRDSMGRCLNCQKQDHHYKECRKPLATASGCLYPLLGQLSDSGDKCRRWQLCMSSYHRSSREHKQQNNTHTTPFEST